MLNQISDRTPLFWWLVLAAAVTITCTLAIENYYRRLSNQPMLAKNPDAYMEETTVWQTNDKGQWSLQFYSPRLTHYPEKHLTVMDTPYFILYQPPRAPWHVFARHGKAFSDGERLDLWDQVIAQQAQGTTAKSTTLYTPALSVYPHQHYAETAKAVTVLQPGLKITALGMKLDTEKSTITFVSHARATYDPKHA